MLAAVNILFLKRSRRNIGSATLVSINGKATRRASPEARDAITHGLLQPIEELPDGMTAYVTTTRARISPSAKVTLPQTSSFLFFPINPTSSSFR
jgi:hypothetical protein